MSGGPAVDAAELRILSTLSIEADPTAGPRFRAAAAQLEGVDLGPEARLPAAAEAAHLLVGLALSGASNELGELLVPDPAVSANRWTVACYEIGGLTPVAIREFDDPVEAVVTVAACADDDHVAAELVASNEQGLRWTALWRTDNHVSFQLPSTDTAEAGEEAEEGACSEDLLDALHRWQVRLAEWSGRDATTAPTEPALPMQLRFPGFPVPAARATPTRTGGQSAIHLPPSRAAAAQLHALEHRLSGIESTLQSFSSELRAFALDAERRHDMTSAAVEDAIDLRFQVLSRVVQAGLDRLGSQITDELQQVVRSDDDEASNVIDMRGSTA
jgi:hypothetical protein